MNKYVFRLVSPSHVPGIDNNQIVPAHTLDEAILKFSRKHELEAPAYWDEPFFDRHIDVQFKAGRNAYRYQITW